MTKTLIEQLKALPRFKVDYEERGGEIYADTFPDENGDCILHSDLRAIIEQYKTEGAEPVAWMAYQGTFQMVADTKDKLPKQSQASAIPLFSHPSPAIVGELVKALEETVSRLYNPFERDNQHPYYHQWVNLISKAKDLK